MKITNVEAIYVRQQEVKAQCDSGQDILIVKVQTDAGITGIGEVDAAPMAVKQIIEGPVSHTITKGLKHIVIGEDPFQTEYLWRKMYRKISMRGDGELGSMRWPEFILRSGTSKARL